MSPEQLAGAVPVDYRCDFFALGAVLYQMATGARPFDILPRNALSSAIQNQPHLPMRQLAPHHPVQLERIIDTLLAKRPDDRYQSAGTLRAELDALHRGMSTGDARRGIPQAASHRSRCCRSTSSARADPRHPRAQRRAGGRPQQPLEPRRGSPGRAADVDARAGRPVGPRDRPTPRRRDGPRRHAPAHHRTRVRVTANLIDAAHERAVRPVAGDRPRVRRRAGDPGRHRRRACATASPPSCRGRRRRRYSPEPEAYHAFKRGQHLWKSCFEGGWRPAIEHFQHAIERDPQFALAHVALASAYNFLGFYSPGQAEPGVCRRRTRGRTRAGHRPDARGGVHRGGAREVRRRLGLGRGRAGVQTGAGARCRQPARARALFVAADRCSAARMPPLPRPQRGHALAPVVPTRRRARARRRCISAAGTTRRSSSAASVCASTRTTCSRCTCAACAIWPSRCATARSPTWSRRPR